MDSLRDAPPGPVLLIYRAAPPRSMPRCIIEVRQHCFSSNFADAKSPGTAARTARGAAGDTLPGSVIAQRGPHAVIDSATDKWSNPSCSVRRELAPQTRFQDVQGGSTARKAHKSRATERLHHTGRWLKCMASSRPRRQSRFSGKLLDISTTLDAVPRGHTTTRRGKWDRLVFQDAKWYNKARELRRGDFSLPLQSVPWHGLQVDAGTP